MKTSFSRQSRCGGFTIIEIMVATAILLVIVVMCSMVMQQQSGAFQGGRDKVAAQAALRTVIGMVSRDLSQAVYDKGNSFSGSGISFYANTGDATEGNGKTIQKISYAAGSAVTRSVDGSPSTIYKGSSVMSLSFTSSGGDAKYPKFVTVKASVPTASNSALVGGHSCGPNGVAETGKRSDDIWVGAKPQ